MKWPSGFSSAGVACGIKSDGAPDLGLIVTDASAPWAGTFTRNAAAAAPVVWSRSQMGHRIRAVVCNSGNANACTGAEGSRAVRTTVEATASRIGCEPEEVLVASTGPIGVRLPVNLVVIGIEPLTANLESDAEGFAQAILTTDTHAKVATAAAGGATFLGVAKGAAMCAPNMATMLAFIATDAGNDAASLESAIQRAVDISFNRISIDGCESTNDSVFLLGSVGHEAVPQSQLDDAVAEICLSLAEQIARDAEGASRLMRIRVEGASSDAAAAHLGRAIADSVLWRCAVHGADPNWGRILSALGSADRELDVEQVSVAIGSELVFDRGEPVGELDAAAKNIDLDEFGVTCWVGIENGAAEILSADTSPDYVRLNAEGTS